MITADQLIAHAVGDYIIQSDWMASEKTKNSVATAVHATTYTLPFLLLCQSIPALLVVCLSHFIIDRWRLARYVVFAKNFLGPKWSRHPWKDCSVTGYSKSRPDWLAFWLLIVADNTLHVLINGLALKFL